jgi:two-component system probable response regulator PhcQ
MPLNRAPYTILLVDDESHATQALSRHFPTERFQVLIAGSAGEAYQLLEWYCVDVIVSDEAMPGQSGSAFLANVRRKYPSIIRMILSGHANLEAAVRAINEGEVYRFFLKPCNPTELLITIQRALDHKGLEVRSRNMLRQFRKQVAVLNAIGQKQPGLLRVEFDRIAAVAIEADDSGELVEDLQREIEASVETERRWLERS